MDDDNCALDSNSSGDICFGLSPSRPAFPAMRFDSQPSSNSARALFSRWFSCVKSNCRVDADAEGETLLRRDDEECPSARDVAEGERDG